MDNLIGMNFIPKEDIMVILHIIHLLLTRSNLHNSQENRALCRNRGEIWCRWRMDKWRSAWRCVHSQWAKSRPWQRVDDHGWTPSSDWKRLMDMEWHLVPPKHLYMFALFWGCLRFFFLGFSYNRLLAKYLGLLGPCCGYLRWSETWASKEQSYRILNYTKQ